MTDQKLPDGWRWAKLRELCNQLDYGYTASADFSINSPRFLRITDIQDGQVDWDNTPGCEIKPETELKKRLSAGDIVIARTGGTVGKSFLIDDPPRAVFASYLIRLQPTKEVLPEFLYAFLQSNGYWRQIHQDARGGAQPNVNAKMLGNLGLPVPSLEIQREIVAILIEQMAAVEQARAAAEVQLEAAEVFVASYLREVFESEEAKGWTSKQIDDIAKTSSGTTPRRGRDDYYTNGSIPWVKTGELLDNVIYDTEEHVTELALQKTSLKLLPIDTLLIAMYGQGQTRGRTARLGISATTNQACFAIWPNSKEFEPAYLQWWFRHSYSRLREQTEGRGGNQPNLNGQVLRAERVPLPPLAKQKQITARLTDAMKDVEQMRASLQEQLNLITKLPAALLRCAFSGEL